MNEQQTTKFNNIGLVQISNRYSLSSHRCHCCFCMFCVIELTENVKTVSYSSTEVQLGGRAPTRRDIETKLSDSFFAGSTFLRVSTSRLVALHVKRPRKTSPSFIVQMVFLNFININKIKI